MRTLLFILVFLSFLPLWSQETTAPEESVVEDFFPPGEGEKQGEVDEGFFPPGEGEKQGEVDEGFFPPGENDKQENNDPETKKQNKTPEQQNKTLTSPELEEETTALPTSDDSGSVEVNPDADTRKITISGSIGFNYIFREDLFADSTLGANSTNLDGDFFDPLIYLRFDIQMNRNIRGVIELHNESRIEQLFVSQLGNLHITNRSEDNAFQFEFESAYVETNDFLLKGLRARLGIIPFTRSLRADGESFFLGLGEAESPFADGEDVNARGIAISWQPTPALELYVEPFYLVTSETGFARQDELITGINIDIDLSKDIEDKEDQSSHTLVRLFNLVFAAIEGDNRQPIWSFGFGFDYGLSSTPGTYDLELYGEALFQFGIFGRAGIAPAFALRDQDHLAFGGYIGARYTYHKSDWEPFIDASFWYISGDDDDPNAKTNRDLVTYEDIDTTLIVEENDYGFDIDSNYWAIKFKSGISLKPLVKEEGMRFEVLYAHFEAIDVPSGGSNHIGEELDVRLVWQYSSDLTFILAAGLLFNSSFLKDVFDEVGADGKQSVFLLRFETSLRF